MAELTINETFRFRTLVHGLGILVAADLRIITYNLVAGRSES